MEIGYKTKSEKFTENHKSSHWKKITKFLSNIKLEMWYHLIGNHIWKHLLWKLKGVLKICSKFTVEHPCRSAISIQLLCNFIEITLRHECFPVNLLHIFRTPFTKNTSGWMLLTIIPWRACSRSLRNLSLI